MAIISTGTQNTLTYSVSEIIYDELFIFTKYIFDSDDIQETNGTLKITLLYKGLDLKKYPIPTTNITIINTDNNLNYTIKSFQSLKLDIKLPTGNYKIIINVLNSNGTIKETKEQYSYFGDILNLEKITDKIIDPNNFDNYLFNIFNTGIIKIAYNKEILSEEDLIEDIYYYDNTELGIPVRCFKFTNFNFDSTKKPICAKLMINQCQNNKKDMILAEDNYYNLIKDLLKIIIHLKSLKINKNIYKFIMDNPNNDYSSFVIQIN